MSIKPNHFSITTSDALHQTSTDKADNLVAIQNPNGTQTHFSYDVEGRLQVELNPLKQETTYLYDPLDRVIASKDASDAMLVYGYSKHSTLESIIDPLGNTTAYAYDSQANLTQTRYPDQSSQATLYSPDDKPVMLTLKDHETLFMDYAPTGEFKGIVGGSVALEYGYDRYKRLERLSTKQSQLTLTYNTLGEVQTQTQDGIAVHHKRIPHSYNTTLEYLDQRIHTHIDTPNRRTTITRNQAQHIVLSYDIETKTQSIKYPNGTQEHYSFNHAGELQTLQSTHPHHTLNIDYHYQRDALGRIVKLNDDRYSYDPQGRLTQANNKTFTYDAAGNNQHHNATYNTSNNQLLEDNTFTYTYDKRGNLTRKIDKQSQELYIYKYNALNQLIHHYKATAEDSYIYKTDYLYDALNRRIVKTTYTKETDTTTSHRYLYHNENIIAILDNTKEEPTLLASIVHHPSRTDTPLSITNHTTNQTYYYHRDHQGSIVALTNEEGKVVESIAYDGHYGTILNHTIQEENLTLNPYGYTGREIDQSDLYYYRARYYDPHTQRFLSTDPIEFKSHDWNFYRYVKNDPLNWVDPTGLTKTCPVNPPSIGDDWNAYYGDPDWFHCGYQQGFLENRKPTPENPIAECFYDDNNTLVDDKHPYSGCGGTPDQYGQESPLMHTVWDDGGIVWAGMPAAYETARKNISEWWDGISFNKMIGQF